VVAARAGAWLAALNDTLRGGKADAAAEAALWEAATCVLQR
jgi:hypothetical protein